MITEQRLPIQEYEVEIRNPLVEEIVERLKEPTRLVGNWYMKVANPNFWYGRAFPGDFQDRQTLENFKEKFNMRSVGKPELKNPYTFIDSRWRPRSINELSGVKELLEMISQRLVPISELIKRTTNSHNYQTFADYLYRTAEALPEGRFDDIMIDFLRLPAQFGIGWMALPVENYDDPLGIKASPQGFLSRTNWRQTRRTNRDIGEYRKVAKDLFGELPVDAKVVVAQSIINSGFLGREDKVFSAFNIPNDPEISKRAGNTVIYIFPNKIAAKNEKKLSHF